MPTDFKPMPAVGKGLEEIRIRNRQEQQGRQSDE
jgi:hypothetical protein